MVQDRAPTHFPIRLWTIHQCPLALKHLQQRAIRHTLQWESLWSRFTSLSSETGACVNAAEKVQDMKPSAGSGHTQYILCIFTINDVALNVLYNILFIVVSSIAMETGMLMTLLQALFTNLKRRCPIFLNHKLYSSFFFITWKLLKLLVDCFWAEL